MDLEPEILGLGFGWFGGFGGFEGILDPGDSWGEVYEVSIKEILEALIGKVLF
jgi:hypothetical protein